MHPKFVAAVAVSAFVLLSVSSSPASAGSRGPAFGNNRYRTEIRTVRESLDIDDYVAPLLAGERVTVVVSTDRKSGLRPTLSFIAPDGVPVDVEIGRAHV